MHNLEKNICSDGTVKETSKEFLASQKSLKIEAKNGYNKYDFIFFFKVSRLLVLF